jgi:hypothetical protein
MLKWSIRALAAAGALALALLSYLVVTYSLARARERSPLVSDLAHVLSWANINNRTRIERIDCAHASTRNWLVADQTKVYTFRVKPLPESAFAAENEHLATWMRGPFTESLNLRALETAVMFARQSPCAFPQLATLNSPRYFVSFQTITAHHGQTETVVITAYDTQTATIHHADVRW